MNDDPKDLTEALFQNSLYVGLNGEAKAPEPHPKYSKGYIDPETGAWRPFKLKRQVRTRHPAALDVHTLAALNMMDPPHDEFTFDWPNRRIHRRAYDRIRDDMIRFLRDQPRRRIIWPSLGSRLHELRQERMEQPPIQSCASDITARSIRDLVLYGGSDAADAAAFCLHALHNHDTISIDVETSKTRFYGDTQTFVIGVDWANIADKDHPQNEVPGAD